MRLHDLVVSVWCVGTGTLGLASMEMNAGMIQSISVLITALAGFIYTMARVYHIWRHIQDGSALDDPDKEPARPPVTHRHKHNLKGVHDE